MSKKEGQSGKKQRKPKVHKDLDGFEVSIDQFGELKSNMKIERLNDFLDKNVDDKKFAKGKGKADKKKGKK